jgi:LPS sulfotransferase NodH
MKSLHVIHLKRRNILRALVSEKIAQDSRVWSTTNKNQLGCINSKKVSFTVDELTKGFEQTENWEIESENMFSDHRMLSVYYEDLVCDTETWFKKILEFLGVQYFDPETKLLRQNPESLSDLIENYAELRDTFIGKKWGNYFTEISDQSV